MEPTKAKRKKDAPISDFKTSEFEKDHMIPSSADREFVSPTCGVWNTSYFILDTSTLKPNATSLYGFEEGDSQRHQERAQAQALLKFVLKALERPFGPTISEEEAQLVRLFDHCKKNIYEIPCPPEEEKNENENEPLNDSDIESEGEDIMDDLEMDGPTPIKNGKRRFKGKKKKPAKKKPPVNKRYQTPFLYEKRTLQEPDPDVDNEQHFLKPKIVVVVEPLFYKTSMPRESEDLAELFNDDGPLDEIRVALSILFRKQEHPNSLLRGSKMENELKSIISENNGNPDCQWKKTAEIMMGFDWQTPDINYLYYAEVCEGKQPYPDFLINLSEKFRVRTLISRPAAILVTFNWMHDGDLQLPLYYKVAENLTLNTEFREKYDIHREAGRIDLGVASSSGSFEKRGLYGSHAEQARDALATQLQKKRLLEMNLQYVSNLEDLMKEINQYRENLGLEPLKDDFACARVKVGDDTLNSRGMAPYYGQSSDLYPANILTWEDVKNFMNIKGICNQQQRKRLILRNGWKPGIFSVPFPVLSFSCTFLKFPSLLHITFPWIYALIKNPNVKYSDLYTFKNSSQLRLKAFIYSIKDFNGMPERFFPACERVTSLFGNDKSLFKSMVCRGQTKGKYIDIEELTAYSEGIQEVLCAWSADIANGDYEVHQASRAMLYIKDDFQKLPKSERLNLKNKKRLISGRSPSSHFIDQDITGQVLCNILLLLRNSNLKSLSPYLLFCILCSMSSTLHYSDNDDIFFTHCYLYGPASAGKSFVLSAIEKLLKAFTRNVLSWSAQAVFQLNPQENQKTILIDEISPKVLINNSSQNAEFKALLSLKDHGRDRTMSIQQKSAETSYITSHVRTLLLRTYLTAGNVYPQLANRLNQGAFNRFFIIPFDSTLHRVKGLSENVVIDSENFEGITDFMEILNSLNTVTSGCQKTMVLQRGKNEIFDVMINVMEARSRDPNLNLGTFSVSNKRRQNSARALNQLLNNLSWNHRLWTSHCSPYAYKDEVGAIKLPEFSFFGQLAATDYFCVGTYTAAVCSLSSLWITLISSHNYLKTALKFDFEPIRQWVNFIDHITTAETGPLRKPKLADINFRENPINKSVFLPQGLNPSSNGKQLSKGEKEIEVFRLAEQLFDLLKKGSTEKELSEKKKNITALANTIYTYPSASKKHVPLLFKAVDDLSVDEMQKILTAYKKDVEKIYANVYEFRWQRPKEFKSVLRSFSENDDEELSELRIDYPTLQKYRTFCDNLKMEPRLVELRFPKSSGIFTYSLTSSHLKISQLFKDIYAGSELPILPFELEEPTQNNFCLNLNQIEFVSDLRELKGLADEIRANIPSECFTDDRIVQCQDIVSELSDHFYWLPDLGKIPFDKAPLLIEEYAYLLHYALIHPENYPLRKQRLVSYKSKDMHKLDQNFPESSSGKKTASDDLITDNICTSILISPFLMFFDSTCLATYITRLSCLKNTPFRKIPLMIPDHSKPSSVIFATLGPSILPDPSVDSMLNLMNHSDESIEKNDPMGLKNESNGPKLTRNSMEKVFNSHFDLESSFAILSNQQGGGYGCENIPAVMINSDNKKAESIMDGQWKPLKIEEEF